MKTACHLFFETLGTKLKIDLLLELKESPLSVGQLSTKLGLERSRVSHALISLLNCNFISVEKSGRERIYFLNKKTILPLLNLVDKHIKNNCKFCRKN